MAGTSEHYGLVTGVVTDDFIEPEHHNRLAATLDRVLGSFLKRMMAAGVYAGWEVGLDGDVSAGEGLVNGCWCNTTAAQAVTGLTSGAMNYVFARTEAASAPEGVVSFFAQVSATKPAGAILLARAEADAGGVVTSVDNDVAGADRNCRRLEVGEAQGSGMVTAVQAGAEFAVTVTHEPVFVVPGALELETSSQDFAWEIGESYRGDGFVISGKNEGAVEADFVYRWSRRGFVG